MRAVVCPLLIVVAVTLVGCGSSDSEDTSTAPAQGPPLSKARFIAEADAICKSYDKSFAALSDKMFDLGVGEQHDQRMADLLRKTADQSTRMFQELQTLTPPPEDVDTIDNYLSTAAGAIDLMDNLADAYDSENEAQIEAVADEMSSESENVNAIVQGYGFKVCGSEGK